MQQLLAFDAQPSERLSQLYPMHLSNEDELQACAITFSAYVTNCTTNRHSLIFLRWEKDKDNTVTEQKTSSSGLLPRSSMSLCHRKLRYQQVLPGSPSKTLSANCLCFLPFWPTWLYMRFILSSPSKHQNILSFYPRVWSLCNLSQQVREKKSYKEKRQNCTCLLKLSKRIE